MFFSTTEDLQILKYVTKDRYPKDPEEFKKICRVRKSWTCLKKSLNRPYISIATRWAAFIEPTILAHLYGMIKFDWKKDFFQFVVDSKALGVGDINWKVACEKWPFCTKGTLFNSLLGSYAKGKGIPLYQILEPLVKDAHFPERYFQRRITLAEAYDNMTA